jgi:hypothetical protein
MIIHLTLGKVTWPHIDIMREVAAAHGLTLQELRAPDHLPSRYEARREAAMRRRRGFAGAACAGAETPWPV